MIMKAKIFLTALALVAVTTFATAQNPKCVRGNGNCKVTGKSTTFVDSNKDGICDNQGAGKSATPKLKRDGSGQGQKLNYVDNNKNGVCDTNEARQKK
jgi:hypothetical protein